MNFIRENIKIWLVLCLTLGLAPFKPPHIWEKITWFIEGKHFRPLDWFDVFLHGAPWVLLILGLILHLRNKS